MNTMISTTLKKKIRNYILKFVDIFVPASSNKQNLIGIDLGTANMVAYLNGNGVVFNEPSFLAFNNKTNNIVAIGENAKKMIGRTPKHLTVIQPLIDGVISDFEASEELLRYIISFSDKINPKIFAPKVVVGVPSDATEVDAKSIREAALAAGAKTVYVVLEPYAALVGMGVNLKQEKSILVLDIGGGTTDLIVISFGEIIAKRTALIAGDKLDLAINNFLKEKKNIIAGRVTTELLKISALTTDGENNFIVCGRDVTTGLPVEQTVTKEEIFNAIMPLIEGVIASLESVLKEISPEISADIVSSQMYLVGGGANISGLKAIIEDEINIPVTIPKDPMTIVAKGGCDILANVDDHRHVFIGDEEN